MGSRSDEVETAQHRLFIAVVIFTLASPVAWLAASFHHDNAKPTLPGRIYDFKEFSGKVFLFGMLATGMFMVLSRYGGSLQNASGGPWGNFARDASAMCFIVTALFGTPWAQIAVFERLVPGIHVCGAAVAFSLFVAAELSFLYNKLDQLSLHEKESRILACGALLASILMLIGNHLLEAIVPSTAVFAGWAFRFEFLVDSAFVWQCGIIYAFSFRHHSEEASVNDLPVSWLEWTFMQPWQFLFLIIAILYDMFNGHGDLLLGFIMPVTCELYVFGVVWLLCYHWVTCQVHSVTCPDDQCPLFEDCCIGRPAKYGTDTITAKDT